MSSARDSCVTTLFGGGVGSESVINGTTNNLVTRSRVGYSENPFYTSDPLTGSNLYLLVCNG